jgi:hypothetical protein
MPHDTLLAGFQHVLSLHSDQSIAMLHDETAATKLEQPSAWPDFAEALIWELALGQEMIRRGLNLPAPSANPE